MRLVLSLLMTIGIIAGFGFFIVPKYHNIQAMRVQAADYNQILDNARKLEQERNRLVQKYNEFDPSELAKLNVMLPQNPNNVKLILQLDALASQYGTALQNVKIEDAPADATSQARSGSVATGANPNIGTLGINFTVVGPYEGFTQFLKALETSLRIVDVKKISFASVDDKPNYQYTVGIKSYWLK